MNYQKKNKYNNQKVKIGEYTFDSQKEANHWKELMWLERSGQIKDLKRQVKFELIPAQYEEFERFGKDGKQLKNGKRCVERSVDYYADFTYFDLQTLQMVVEDTKSPITRTKEYIIKRKLMLYIYGIKIREI